MPATETTNSKFGARQKPQRGPSATVGFTENAYSNVSVSHGMHWAISSFGYECGEAKRVYLSPEPLLQEPSYQLKMASEGMPVPSYAYAGNNPIRNIDPDGKELIAGPFNGLFSSEEQRARLNRAIKQLNSPQGACSCALTKGGGYSNLPWDGRPVVVVLDPSLSWRGASGFTNPLGFIYVSPELSEAQMMSTIAHEGGHLRFPYLGHGNKQKRFDDPAQQCDSDYRQHNEPEYLRQNPVCACP